MLKGNILGIDLAKNIFHVCEMSPQGRVVRRARLSREQLSAWVVCNFQGVIAMEACGGSHYWARLFESRGYDVRIIAAQFVKPFVKSNKNDRIDAEAICEAALRPQMRFVAMRSEAQQDIQNLHRIRERLVCNRTALTNEIRGLLLEYGIVMPKGIQHVRKLLPGILETHKGTRSPLWAKTFMDLYREFCDIDCRIEECDSSLKAISRTNEDCARLEKIPGVGTLGATAIVAAVGSAKHFKNGREFAAWLGLVPRQYSTGGKSSLGRISKRGDPYIRRLLVLGARSAAIAAERKRNHEDPGKRAINRTNQWLFNIADRRGRNRAVVALANKTARHIWVVLGGADFKQPEQLTPLAA
jgi:transposase